MLANQTDGLQPIFALGDHVDVIDALEEEGEFVARELFVIDDDRRQGHAISGKMILRSIVRHFIEGQRPALASDERVIPSGCTRSNEVSQH